MSTLLYVNTTRTKTCRSKGDGMALEDGLDVADGI